MTSEFNVKELILKDVISKHKTGKSTLEEWKLKAQTYYAIKRFYELSFISICISSTFLILKRNSGRRNIYMTVFGLSALSLFYFNMTKNSLYNELKKESNIKNDQTFKEFLHFHRYALI